jgi:antitoxin component YwqK of YwqJK toxin-antitoxin module
VDSFYDNGSPRYTGELVDGKMHGPWQFFRKDGSLMRAGSFHADKQIGIWTTYDRNGQVVKVTDFDKKTRVTE